MNWKDVSDRMSSRPMGWSMAGTAKMAWLRAYYLNGGNMLELDKCVESISHNMSLQNRKTVYFNAHIWGL